MSTLLNSADKLEVGLEYFTMSCCTLGQQELDEIYDIAAWLTKDAGRWRGISGGPVLRRADGMNEAILFSAVLL